MFSYPSPLVGSDGDKPAFWAEKSREADWGCGSRLRARPESLLYSLHQLPLRREPATRNPKDGLRFSATISSRVSNVEALHAQVVGTKMPLGYECFCCQAGQGPFVSCVRVTGLMDLMPACANCHWGEQGHRCHFPALTDAATPTLPPATTEAALFCPTKTSGSCVMEDQLQTIADLDRALEREVLAGQIAQEELKAAQVAVRSAHERVDYALAAIAEHNGYLQKIFAAKQRILTDSDAR